MSADNWTTCPRCKAKHEQAILDDSARVSALYGKISAEQYEAERRAHAAKALKSVPEEFREDYQIGINSDGVFVVGYSGVCRDCGLEHSFSHHSKVKL